MKKKLTVTNVRRTYKRLGASMYNLILDKMGHANSSVPMSLPKLLEMHKALQNAEKRIKQMWDKYLDDDRSFEQLIIRLIVISYIIEKGLASGMMP